MGDWGSIPGLGKIFDPWIAFIIIIPMRFYCHSLDLVLEYNQFLKQAIFFYLGTFI